MHAEAAAPDAESELLASFRMRTAAAARNAAWITLAGIALLTAPHHEFNDLGAHNLVWLVIGVAAFANTLTYLPHFERLLRRGLWPFYTWIILLLMFDGLVVYVSHDAEHQIYLIYIPVLLFAVTTLEPFAAFGVLVLAAATAVAATTRGSDFSRDAVVGSTSSFVVVWLLGLYFAAEQRREIVQTVAERARAIARGAKLQELNEHAETLNRRLQRAVASVIRAQEQERSRIGRELHDEAVQTLSSASMRLGAIEERIDAGEGDPALLAGVTDVRKMLIDALWEIRKIIVALRPSDLDDLGLVPALSSYARTRLDQAGVALEVEATARAPRLAGDVETAVFRIAQEAVNNVARHAHAELARLLIQHADGRLRVRVEDDGVGFDVGGTHARANGEGLGLEGMRERAALVGAELGVESRPGAGTVVQVSVPVGVAV